MQRRFTPPPHTEQLIAASISSDTADAEDRVVLGSARFSRRRGSPRPLQFDLLGSKVVIVVDDRRTTVDNIFDRLSGGAAAGGTD
jgi:hypothetical protein